MTRVRAMIVVIMAMMKVVEINMTFTIVKMVAMIVAPLLYYTIV